jgi:superoxide oxidase
MASQQRQFAATRTLNRNNQPMSATAPPAKYAPPSIILHWATLLLIVATYIMILTRGYFPRGSDMRDGLKMWHFMLGLSVLVLVLIRVAARILRARPPITPSPPAWQKYLSQTVHLALYAFMLAMPLLGWTILSAEGATIQFYGLELFPLVSKSKVLAEQVQEIHETIGTIAYYVIGLHAAAALMHHYYLKDNTLKRMLPGKG